MPLLRGRQHAAPGMTRYHAYGLTIACDLPLPLRRCSPAEVPDLSFVYEGPAAPGAPSGPDRRHLSQRGNGWTLRYDNSHGGWMAFDYSAREQTVRVSGSAPWQDCAGPLAGVVCGVLLRTRGGTPLHAAAVRIGGRAVAIAGASGDGKSTLAGALIARGAELLTEDLLAVRQGAGGFTAEAGATTLNLLADAHRHLTPGLGSGKARVGPTGKFETALDEAEPVASTPLSAIFILTPAEPAATSGMSRLPPLTATGRLLEHLYGNSWITPTGSSDLELCAAISKHVPVLTVSRCWSLARLGETAALLERYGS